MAEENTNNQELNTEEISTTGQKIYEEIKVQLEPDKNGKYVAIEIKSKEYFIAESKEVALDEAQKDFPNSVFFVRKIGELEKISSRYHLRFLPEQHYDKLF